MKKSHVQLAFIIMVLSQISKTEIFGYTISVI